VSTARCPVTEDSELRSRPSPDLTPDLDFDNLAVEQAVEAADLPVTVLRCPVIYGPLDTQRRLKPYIRQMLDNRPAIVLDSRLARLRMSRGYVENVAQAAVLAASSDRAAGRTYNVGEVDALSEAEWVREIAAALGWDGDVVVDPEGPLPVQDLYANTSRIRAELGYVESISRPEGLRRAVEWERAQPN
jgi:nucleoside-diphosphate-sugar epimerase